MKRSFKCSSLDDLFFVWRRGLVKFTALADPTNVKTSRAIFTDAPNDQSHHPSSFYDSTVEEYARLPLTKLTLSAMLQQHRDIFKSAQFAHQELPKRLARRLLDLQLLPYIVVTNPHFLKVYKAYHHAFEILRTTPLPTTTETNKDFSLMLTRLVDEHAPMLDALANGLRELKRKPLIGSFIKLNTFLESMLRSRISRRLIAEHHINLDNPRPGYIGIVCTDLSLADTIEFAAERCKKVCFETYGASPDILVTGDKDVRVPYIAAHLDYMAYELLKNASRAAVERYVMQHRRNGVVFPSILVQICGGIDDVTIRISDQGGGIPDAHLSRVWEFGWTDLDTHDIALDCINNNNNITVGSPSGLDSIMTLGSGAGTPTGKLRMAGLGFGLPLSRLYARYFGGDLTVVSMPGYGVDAFLYLKGLIAGKREWKEHESNTSGSG